MSGMSEIKTFNAKVSVWVRGNDVCLLIESDDGHGFERTYLTPEQTDELIRALALARVELSKARP